MSKCTMRDVARLAGVSVATVSAVINGTAHVSERRTQRVREAMEALDYYPDQVARSLKIGRTDVIGMVIPDITNPFFPQVVRGVEDAAREQGYSVILCNSNEDPNEERRLLDTLFSRRVDGVVIACSDASTAYDTLLRRRFPIVFVDRIPRGLTGGGVATDNVDAGYVATQHLIELGHERIAFIAGRLSLAPHIDRLEGFRRAMQTRGLAVRDDYLRMGDHSAQSGWQAATELFALKERPTVLIASNNRMLLGILGAAAELGIRCPAEISIVGFDDYAWTQHFTPRMTMIDQASYQMGRDALSMLVAQVRGGADKPRQDVLLLKAELKVRESTAPPCAVGLSAVVGG